MLRYQNFQIAKLWIPEYGSAKTQAVRVAVRLFALSPRKGGTNYPAILFMTADTDTRVDPMHAKKMAALMQAEAKMARAKRSQSVADRNQSRHGQGSRLRSRSKRTPTCILSSFGSGSEAVTNV